MLERREDLLLGSSTPGRGMPPAIGIMESMGPVGVDEVDVVELMRVSLVLLSCVTDFFMIRDPITSWRRRFTSSPEE